MFNPYIANSYLPNYPQFNINNPPVSNQEQLIRVNGIEGAKAYQMTSPNSTVALFDSNEDILYIKSTDGACFPTLRTFKFNEVTTSMSVANDYVSREEFEQLKKEIEENVKQFISKPSKPSKNAECEQ